MLNNFIFSCRIRRIAWKKGWPFIPLKTQNYLEKDLAFFPAEYAEIAGERSGFFSRRIRRDSWRRIWPLIPLNTQNYLEKDLAFYPQNAQNCLEKDLAFFSRMSRITLRMIRPFTRRMRIT